MSILNKEYMAEFLSFLLRETAFFKSRETSLLLFLCLLALLQVFTKSGPVLILFSLLLLLIYFVLLPLLSRSTFVLSFDLLALSFKASFARKKMSASNEKNISGFLSKLLVETSIFEALL